MHHIAMLPGRSFSTHLTACRASLRLTPAAPRGRAGADELWPSRASTPGLLHGAVATGMAERAATRHRRPNGALPLNGPQPGFGPGERSARFARRPPTGDAAQRLTILGPCPHG